MKHKMKWLIFIIFIIVILLALFVRSALLTPQPKWPVKLVDVSTRLDGGTLNTIFRDQEGDFFEVGFLVEYVSGKQTRTLYFNNFPNKLPSMRINVEVCSDTEDKVVQLLENIKANSSSPEEKEVKFSYSLIGSIENRRNIHRNLCLE